MNADHGCGSCGMPIDDGTYCQYCTDDSGNLQSFEETYERMIQFAMGQTTDLSRAKAETDTLAYMAMMPAWRDHPTVKAAARLS